MARADNDYYNYFKKHFDAGIHEVMVKLLGTCVSVFEKIVLIKEYLVNFFFSLKTVDFRFRLVVWF